MKKIRIKDILCLQLIVMIYTMSGVAAKFAANESEINFKFVLFYGIEICILGVYAIFWQQIIKKFDLSVAYTNRAMDVLWAMLFSFALFHEAITVKKIIGVICIMVGTLVVNLSDIDTEGEADE